MKQVLLVMIMVLTVSAHADAQDAPPETETVALDNIEAPPGLSEGQRVVFDKAVSMLKPSCKQIVGSDFCHSAADRFAREFVNAVAGDYMAQSNTAFAFTVDTVAPRNAIAACAMRQMMASSHNPLYDHAQKGLTISQCWHDGQDLTDAAQTQASRLRHAQAAHPIRPLAVPEIGYDPALGGDEQSQY